VCFIQVPSSFTGKTSTEHGNDMILRDSSRCDDPNNVPSQVLVVVAADAELPKESGASTSSQEEETMFLGSPWSAVSDSEKEDDFSQLIEASRFDKKVEDEAAEPQEVLIFRRARWPSAPRRCRRPPDHLGIPSGGLNDEHHVEEEEEEHQKELEKEEDKDDGVDLDLDETLDLHLDDTLDLQNETLNLETETVNLENETVDPDKETVDPEKETVVPDKEEADLEDMPLSSRRRQLKAVTRRRSNSSQQWRGDPLLIEYQGGEHQ
jgi:hypothetical protein